jgi:hypothetical protein
MKQGSVEYSSTYCHTLLGNFGAGAASGRKALNVSSETRGTTNIPTYTMVGDWADLSAVPGAASCWVHNAIVATDGGEIIGFHGGQLVAGRTEIADLPQRDRFNSPHGGASDADGNLYVSEWLLGGRYTKLAVRR